MLSVESEPGEIMIEAVEFDVTGSLGILNAELLDASKWSKVACRLRTAENESRLILKRKDGIPTPFDDYISSLPAVLETPVSDADNNPERKGEISNKRLFEPDYEICEENQCTGDKCK